MSVLCRHVGPDIAWWHEAHPELRCARCYFDERAEREQSETARVIKVPADRRKRCWQWATTKADAERSSLFAVNDRVRELARGTLGAWAAAQALEAAVDVRKRGHGVLMGHAKIEVVWADSPSEAPMFTSPLGVVVTEASDARMDKNGLPDSVSVLGWTLRDVVMGDAVQCAKLRPLSTLRQSIGIDRAA